MNKPCKLCGSTFLAKGGGGRRVRCDVCYPIFRQARTLYYSILNRTKKSKLECDLTPDFIEQNLRLPCSKTGKKFVLYPELKSRNYSNREPYSASIDRIDNNRGYTKDNVQFVCWIYNLCKNNWTDKEVLDFCQTLVNSFTIKNANVGVQTD